MSPQDVIEFACPGISEAEGEALLWGATGWPCFFKPRRGESVAQCWWRQVWAAARIWRKGWLPQYIDASWNPTPREPEAPHHG